MKSISFLDYFKLNKPQIIKEWDSDKNGVLDSSITYGSNKKYWFVCSECGTEFQTSPHKLAYAKYNCCPNCWIDRRAQANHRKACQKNNLENEGGLLLAEFDIEKNKIQPSEVPVNSNNVYWWKCANCGHKWKATVSNRGKGKGCPRCNKITHTSFPEQAIYYYIKKEYPDAVNGDKHLGIELDVFIPSINIAIEYDGEAWHESIKRDEKKNAVCANNKILLIRVREKKCWAWPNSRYLLCLSAVSNDNNELTETIKRLFFEIRKDLCVPDIDVIRDAKEIRAEYINAKRDNSLIIKCPKIASEWDYEKNDPITPDKIDYGSGIRFWWKCPTCGFSYMMSPNRRTCKGAGCPACSHTVANTGVNDLETLRPDLMIEWDYNRNVALGLNPSMILPNSEKKAYWKCSNCGHEWKTVIGNRTRGHGCPICARNRHMKRVKNLDTGMEFNSIKEAGAYYGKERDNHIGACCKGERKTALGYRWTYI